jgi:hypothetical protein
MKIYLWGGINFAWRCGGKWYSISLATIPRTLRNRMEIKYWGYLWEDGNKQRKLQKSKLSNTTIPFAKPIAEFKKSLQNPLEMLKNDADYTVLFRYLDMLFSQLIEGVKDNFITIPPFDLPRI